MMVLLSGGKVFHSCPLFPHAQVVCSHSAEYGPYVPAYGPYREHKADIDSLVRLATPKLMTTGDGVTFGIL
jgi:hypothetical protein